MSAIMITLESPDATERVLILKRPDGTFTYRRQWRLEATQPMSDDEKHWSPPGPDCGIYDSLDTVDAEARQRIPWLNDQLR